MELFSGDLDVQNSLVIRVPHYGAGSRFGAGSWVDELAETRAGLHHNFAFARLASGGGHKRDRVADNAFALQDAYGVRSCVLRAPLLLRRSGEDEGLFERDHM